MKPVKLILSSKSQLQFKYGKNFQGILKILKKLQAADLKKGLQTRIFFIDDKTSLKSANIKKADPWSEEECKRVIDDLYKKFLPAYLVLLGADDVLPFQKLDNQAVDQDTIIYSDLPYACDQPYSKRIDNFTGPTRVVGRIPDLPGIQQDIVYLETLINNSIRHKPLPHENYRSYFSISTWDWRVSTQISLNSLFGNSEQLITSPADKKDKDHITPGQLKPLTHFINCHGAERKGIFYGQKGKQFPKAFEIKHLENMLTPGTIAVAECCFGAQMYDPSTMEPVSSSIANMYLANNAIAFLGSSTISYGPSDSQSLSDLITQHFIRNILAGASTGRAFLEARQRFLTESGPDLDPYELKTIAQFNLLGDPSVQPAECEEAEIVKFTVGNMIMNTRKNLFIKGMSLQSSISKSERQVRDSPIRDSKQLNTILKKLKLTKNEKQAVYKVQPKEFGGAMGKRLSGDNIKFHAFVKEKIHIDRETNAEIKNHKVLVIKENNDQILGWRVYESK